MVRLGDMSLIRDAQIALRLCFFESGKLVLDDPLALAGDDHPRARFLDVVPVLEEQAPHERWWPLARELLERTAVSRPNRERTGAESYIGDEN